LSINGVVFLPEYPNIQTKSALLLNKNTAPT